MKRAYVATIAVIIIVIVLAAGFMATQIYPSKTADAYVGVTYCGNSVADAKLLIDKVKGYTNLFVLQSGLLQRDFASVDEIGDYTVDAGMYFLPYFGAYIQASFSPWLESAKQKWGDHFLGVYYTDEMGGKMLDDYVQYSDQATGDSITKTRYGDIFVQQPNGVQINYELNGIIHLYQPSSSNEDVNSEATFYPNGTISIVKPAPHGFNYGSYQQLENIRPFRDINETAQRFLERDRANIQYLHDNSKAFTSDYEMYWFDYLSGFDVVLGQIGWNGSFNQQIALMRGAATAQNKEWGAIITWKTQTAPYLASPDEIFEQMQDAYLCGAKYIVVFDYYDANSNAYGSMTQEHFQALEKFWNTVVSNQNAVKGSIKADTAVVLPHNYAGGTRWLGANVWGIFKADNYTAKIWNTVDSTIKEHGIQTDIVYADPAYPLPSTYVNVYNCTNIE